MGYTSKNIVKDGAAIAVPAESTNYVVTGLGGREGFPIQVPFMTAFRADIKVSNVSVTTGITAKLRTRFSNEQAWQDSKTATITADGWVSIAILAQVAGDQTYLPLRPEGCIVITSGASDTVTVDEVRVQVVC